MIDEKRIEEFQKYGPGMLEPGDSEEIGRLARLGLWAKKHGIPALKSVYHDDSGMGACRAAFNPNEKCTCAARGPHVALAALPKETK